MLRLRQWRQLGTTKLPSFLLSLFPFFDFLPDMPAFGLIILCFGFIDSNCQLTAVGEVAFVPNWFGTNHHRVERCAVQQRGWPIPGRHLLFIAIRAHLGQAHRGHPRVQKAQENGHYWSLRWVKAINKKSYCSWPVTFQIPTSRSNCWTPRASVSAKRRKPRSRTPTSIPTTTSPSFPWLSKVLTHVPYIAWLLRISFRGFWHFFLTKAKNRLQNLTFSFLWRHAEESHAGDHGPRLRPHWRLGSHWQS